MIAKFEENARTNTAGQVRLGVCCENSVTPSVCSHHGYSRVESWVINTLYQLAMANSVLVGSLNRPLVVLQTVLCMLAAWSLPAANASTAFPAFCTRGDVRRMQCQGTDVIFLADSSESIDDPEFNSQLQALLTVSNLAFSSVNNLGLAIAEFSVNTTFVSPDYRLTAGAAAIDIVQIQKSSGITFTATALLEAAAFSSANGRGIPQQVVLVSDGQISPEDADNFGLAIGLLQAQSIAVTTVGIGSDRNETRLMEIASATGGSVFLFDNGAQFNAGAADIVAALEGNCVALQCPATTTPSTTPSTSPSTSPSTTATTTFQLETGPVRCVDPGKISHHAHVD